MKKALSIIGICCLAVVLAVGIYFAIPPKTLDFQGTVTEIKINDDNTEFHIELSGFSSYIVVADNKTKVSYCHKDDPEISLHDIKVGDNIGGNYRRFQKNNKAKSITVEYHN